MSVKEKMTTIADAIRAKTGESEPLSLDGMAQGVDKVFAAGEQSEYDRFWDAFQSNGARDHYEGCFRYEFWNADNFRPKYDMVPSTCAAMFDRFGGACDTATDVAYDLAEMLDECGVVLDTSKATNFNNMCYYSSLKRVPLIDMRGCSGTIIGIFALARKLETIDKLILKEDGSQVFQNIFQTANELKHMIVEGTIGTNGFYLGQSYHLSKDSITSVINALSSTASGLSVTLSRPAVRTAFETSAGADDGLTSTEWTALANTKFNWTINLV